MKSEIELMENGNLRIHLPVALRSHGGKKKIVPLDSEAHTPLLTLLARAYNWQKAIDEGKYANGKCLADALGIDISKVSRTLRLTRLSPKIVHAIISGDYPDTLNSTSLRENIPLNWAEQERLFFGRR